VVVDLATGALVRSRASGWPVVATDSSLRASDSSGHDGTNTGPELDVVEIELARDDEPPDPARPEAVMVASAPERLGTPRRRVVRHILRDLLPVDSSKPLLGSLGPSISYVDLDGSRPSVAVIAPDRAPGFTFDEWGTWCQFSLAGRKHRLPVVDERLVEAKDRSRGGTVTNGTVAEVIGGAPRYLVVALGAPHRGQAPKLVLGVLPRP
jgi:hypothetical protein